MAWLVFCHGGVFKYFPFMIPWDVRQWSLLIDGDGIDLVYWVLEHGLDGTIRTGRAYECNYRRGIDSESL